MFLNFGILVVFRISKSGEGVELARLLATLHDVFARYACYDVAAARK